MMNLKLQYFGHLMRRTDALEKTLMLGKIEGRRRRGWQRMRLLDGITDSMDMGLSKLQELVRKRQWHPTPVLLPRKSHGRRSLVGCSPWGRYSWHNWATSLWLFTFMHWRRKWQPTPVFLPGESQGREVWWAAVYGVAQSQTQLKQRSSRSWW